MSVNGKSIWKLRRGSEYALWHLAVSALVLLGSFSHDRYYRMRAIDFLMLIMLFPYGWLVWFLIQLCDWEPAPRSNDEFFCILFAAVVNSYGCGYTVSTIQWLARYLNATGTSGRAGEISVPNKVQPIANPNSDANSSPRTDFPANNQD